MSFNPAQGELAAGLPRKRPLLLIELIGPAGSGKTTAAEPLTHDLQARGLSVLSCENLRRGDLRRGGRHVQKSSPLYRAARLLRLAATHCVFTTSVFLAGILLGPPYRKRAYYATRACGQLDFLTHLRREASFDVVLVDEGIVNVLWSMTLGAPRWRGSGLLRTALAAYVRESNARGIVMTADADLLAARAFSRTGSSRFSVRADPVQRAEFRRWLAYHEKLVELLPDGFVVAQVDANRDPESVRLELLSKIEGLFDAKV